MKKVFILCLCLTTISFGDIKVKVVKPLKFKNLNNTKKEKEKFIAVSKVEIYTNNKEEDLGKKVVLEFPNFIEITNNKKTIRIDGVKIAKEDREFILDKERKEIKFFANLNKKDIEIYDKAELVEGLYEGKLDVQMKIYSKQNRGDGI